LIDECAGFAFHRTGEGGFGYKRSSPAGIFTAELTALFVTLSYGHLSGKQFRRDLQQPMYCRRPSTTYNIYAIIMIARNKNNNKILSFHASVVCSKISIIDSLQILSATHFDDFKIAE
jgi:hypothetical protein